MNYDQIRNKIQVPQELQDPFQRGTLAAMKILFSKETHNMLLKSLDENKGGSVGATVGLAAAGALGYVYSVAKGQLPPNLVIPLGVEIVLQIFQFIEQSGQSQPTPEDFGEAMNAMIKTVLEKMPTNQAPEQAAPQPQPGMIQQ